MSVKNVFLLPGEATYVKEPALISTLLGSCVAVCLHDTRNGWGGMNHYMLPEGDAKSNLEAGKYGDLAIKNLLRVAMMAGSKPADLVASLYGGAAVVGHLGSISKDGNMDIGRRNIDLAEKILAAEGIKIIKRDLGGNLGRRIHMDTLNNTIRVKTIDSSAMQPPAPAEKLSAPSVNAKPNVGRKPRVLVVDDSVTVRRILTQAIDASPHLEVCGEAEDPYQARERILEVDPDVLCLDIIMPRLDGLSFLKKIMKYKPIPTVIVSTIAKAGSKMEANVKAAGAVDVVDKETLEIYRGVDVINSVLVPKLIRAAGTHVQKRG